MNKLGACVVVFTIVSVSTVGGLDSGFPKETQDATRWVQDKVYKATRPVAGNALIEWSAEWRRNHEPVVISP